MKNPYFSICMPSYNRELFLNDAINSVIQQSFHDFEFLILDDCSTDNSLQIIKSYNDKRIKLLELKTKQPVSFCRNLLIKQAIGKFIIFIDSDDYFATTDALETISKNIPSDNNAMLCFNFNDFFVEKDIVAKTNIINFSNRTFVYPENPFYDFANALFGPALWNKVYSNEIIKLHHLEFPNHIEIGEDYVFNLLYCLQINKIVTIDHPLYTRRIHSNSLFESNKNFEYRYKNWIAQNNYFLKCSKTKNEQSKIEMFSYLMFHRYSKAIRKHYFSTFKLFQSVIGKQLKLEMRKCYKNTPLDKLDLLFAKAFFDKFFRIFGFPFAFLMLKIKRKLSR